MESPMNYQKYYLVEAKCWPAEGSELGEVVDERYYVLNKFEEQDFWICWDLLQQQDVAIKAMNDIEETQMDAMDFGELLENRFYVMNHLETEEKYWLCYDIKMKVDVIIKAKELSSDHLSWQSEDGYESGTEMGFISSTLESQITETNGNGMNEMINDEVKQKNSSNSTDFFESGMNRQLYYPVEVGWILDERYEVLQHITDRCHRVFATVWLCWDHVDQILVAIKIFNPAYERMGETEFYLIRCVHRKEPKDVSQDLIIRVLNEFHITDLKGNQALCIVLQAMDGNLLGYLAFWNRNMPLPIVKTITRQLLTALDYLHTNCNIIHADIKLENVLYQTDAKIKLADFGSSVWADRHNNAVITTRPYRSVEVILGAEYGCATDIWSAACLIFELATGGLPFGRQIDGYPLSDLNHISSIVLRFGDIPIELKSRSKNLHNIFDEDGLLRTMKHPGHFSLLQLLIETYGWSQTVAEEFASFLEPMFKLDPTKRATAAECLEHPWLKSSTIINEETIRAGQPRVSQRSFFG